ncbi:MAG: hypothetical protein HOQ09_00290 [Gemmatimonadaceae bacterium]|nr:hypothetical protein [Gemmatimonadaceae bacterium]
MRDLRFALAGLIGVIAFAACGGGGNSTAPGGGGAVGGGGGTGGGGVLVHAQRVTATTSLTFQPSTVTIAPGDTIYFTFETVQHNVVFDTQGSPGNVGTSSSITVKRQFPTAGTYDYHCSLHAGMTGSVTVQ